MTPLSTAPAECCTLFTALRTAGVAFSAAVLDGEPAASVV